MKKILKQSNEFAKQICTQLANAWSTINKADLEIADGRRKNAPVFATSGSYLYVAYENACVLYVGETSVSVKKRFSGHGSGAHNKKDWYSRMSHVNYIKATHDELPVNHRKLLEQALSIALKPEYYRQSNKSLKLTASSAVAFAAKP